MPENGRRLKELFADSDGLLIASPEYNSSLSGVLKNTLDWVSRRSEPDEKPLLAFRGKAAAIMSASPGRLGGLRGLVHLRSILGNLGVLVLPEQRTVSGADKTFAEDGALENEEQLEAVRALGEKLATVLTKLSA